MQWTTRKIARLRALYAENRGAGYAQLAADEFGVSRRSIYRKACDLGIAVPLARSWPRHKPPADRWPPDKVAAVRRLLAQQMSQAEIAAALGVSPAAVGGICRRLKLRQRSSLTERYGAAAEPSP